MGIIGFGLRSTLARSVGATSTGRAPPKDNLVFAVKYYLFRLRKKLAHLFWVLTAVRILSYAVDVIKPNPED